MTWLEFAAALIDSLAWPFAAVVLAALFRNELGDLVASLRRLKYKDLEATFGAELRNVEAQVMPPVGEATAASAHLPSAITRLAGESPRAAILDSWIALEAAATAAVKARKPEEYGPRFTLGPGLLAHELVETGVLDEKKAGSFKSLARLRNLAVHSAEFAVSSEQALGFARTARSLTDELAG